MSLASGAPFQTVILASLEFQAKVEDPAEVDALECATGPLGPKKSGSTCAGDRERDLEFP